MVVSDLAPLNSACSAASDHFGMYFLLRTMTHHKTKKYQVNVLLSDTDLMPSEIELNPAQVELLVLLKYTERTH